MTYSQKLERRINKTCGRTKTTNPCPYEPLDLPDPSFAVNPEIHDPFTELFLSSFSPLKPSNTENTSPFPEPYEQPMTISDGEDTIIGGFLTVLTMPATLSPVLPSELGFRPRVGQLGIPSTFQKLDNLRSCGPSQTRPRKNHPSPYPKGKNTNRDLSSHPSDVGQTAQTGRRSRRYLTLSFPFQTLIVLQDCARAELAFANLDDQRAECTYKTFVAS